MMQNVTTLEWFSLIADIIGIAGALFALFAWQQARQIRKEQKQEATRQSKVVKVTLQYGKEKSELPVQLRRAELFRAEILGRIGMIPMKKRRAVCHYLFEFRGVSPTNLSDY